MFRKVFSFLFGSSPKPGFFIHDGVRHCRPKYYGYRGGFAELTECVDCNALALYEDAHPVRPCHYCGGELNDGVVGVWRNDRWVLRAEYKRVKCEFY